METIMTNPSKTALVPIVLRDCLISSWRWHLTAAAGSLGTVAVGRSSCLLAKMARMAMEKPLFIDECPIDTSSSRGMPVCQQMEAALAGAALEFTSTARTSHNEPEAGHLKNCSLPSGNLT